MLCVHLTSFYFRGLSLFWGFVLRVHTFPRNGLSHLLFFLCFSLFAHPGASVCVCLPCARPSLPGWMLCYHSSVRSLWGMTVIYCRLTSHFTSHSCIMWVLRHIWDWRAQLLTFCFSSWNDVFTLFWSTTLAELGSATQNLHRPLGHVHTSTSKYSRARNLLVTYRGGQKWTLWQQNIICCSNTQKRAKYKNSQSLSPQAEGLWWTLVLKGDFRKTRRSKALQRLNIQKCSLERL